ncbi:auxin-induced protein 15A-like protein, partial [Tanacetum coccineum]
MAKIRSRKESPQSERLLSDGEEEKSSSPSSKTPTGSFTLYIGEERRRFVVPMGYLSHPLFKMLLEKSSEEFGFGQRNGIVSISGISRLTCDVDYRKKLVLFLLEEQETNKEYANMDGNQWNGGRMHNRDFRSFAEVEKERSERRKRVPRYYSRGMGIIGKQNHHDNKISGENIMANQVDGERIILIEEKDLNNEIICRSVTGEVKATCFLYKLPVLCEEQGLNSIEVKLLGGLEVMENEETATNVLKDKDHGLRRWL